MEVIKIERQNKNASEGFERFSNADEIRATIVARMRKFSDIHYENPLFGILLVYPRFKEHYEITIFKNGYNTSTEGFLSIEFDVRTMFNTVPSLLNAVIAVMDVEGTQRFPKSFLVSRKFYLDDLRRKFIIDKYISRSVLLNPESLEELLPDDTLTLHMEVCFQKTATDENDLLFREDVLYDAMRNESQRYPLKLGSYFFKRLAEESTVFERMRVTPMEEMSSGEVRIPTEEVSNFAVIAHILLDEGPISFESIGDIFDLYVTAEKYDIRIVMDTCRSWLVRSLTGDNATLMREFADMFDDDRMREAVEDFLRRPEDVRDDGGVSTSKAAAGTNERLLFEREDSGPVPLLELLSEDEDKKSEEYDFYS